jgi:hypothetical protein
MRIGDGSFRDGQLSTDTNLEKLGKKAREKTHAAPPVDTTEGPSPFAKILHGLGREVDRGEALVRRATGGGGGQDLGNVELLALQAGVYRYSEAVDLSAKLVDRATSGVKTVLQGQ